MDVWKFWCFKIYAEVNMDVTVISLGGPLRAGKDTAAMHILTRVSGVKEKISLADELKVEYAAMHDIPLEDLYNQSKEKHRPGLIELGSRRRTEDRFYWARKLVDVVFRHWALWDMPSVNNDKYTVVIPDNRYIQEMSVPALIKQRAPSIRVVQHSLYISATLDTLSSRFTGSVKDLEALMLSASENSLGEYDFSTVISNDETMSDFHARLDSWIKRLKL